MATIRQRKAIDKVIENRGASVSGAMREAGYDDTTAKNPKNLTDSKAWAELMEEYLPDNLILQALADDIRDKRRNRKPELELAAKLKGKLTDKTDVTSGGESIQFVVTRSSEASTD